MKKSFKQFFVFVQTCLDKIIITFLDSNFRKKLKQVKYYKLGRLVSDLKTGRMNKGKAAQKVIKLDFAILKKSVAGTWQPCSKVPFILFFECENFISKIHFLW